MCFCIDFQDKIRAVTRKLMMPATLYLEKFLLETRERSLFGAKAGGCE